MIARIAFATALAGLLFIACSDDETATKTFKDIIVSVNYDSTNSCYWVIDAPGNGIVPAGASAPARVDALFGYGNDLLFFGTSSESGGQFHLWGEVGGDPVDDANAIGANAIDYAYAAFDGEGELHVSHTKGDDWDTMQYTRHVPGASAWVTTNLTGANLRHKTLVMVGGTLHMVGVDNSTEAIHVIPNLPAGAAPADTGKKSDYNIMGAAIGTELYIVYNNADAPGNPLVVSALAGTPVVLNFTNSSVSNLYVEDMAASGDKLYITGYARDESWNYYYNYWVYTPATQQQECHVFHTNSKIHSIAAKDGTVYLAGFKDSQPALWVGTNVYTLTPPAGAGDFWATRVFLRYKN